MSAPLCLAGRNGPTRQQVIRWIQTHISYRAAREASRKRNKTELCMFLNQLLQQSKEQTRRGKKQVYGSSPTETKKEEKKKKLRANEYEMLIVTHDEKSEAYQRFSKLVQLPENHPAPTWADEKLLPTSRNEYTFAFLDDNLIGTYVQTSTQPTKRLVSLDLINVHPMRMGERLCKPFTKRVIQYFLDEGYTDVVVSVFSATEDGIPACLCYYRAARELGLEIYYYEKGEKLVPLSTEERCLDKATNQMDLHFRRPTTRLTTRK